MAKKFGTIVKEARAAKKLSQAALAEAVSGLSASDVGKIEKNEKIPAEAVIKQMAKPLGLTQKALLEAAGLLKDTAKTAAAKKTDTAKKTSSAKKADSAKKTSSAKTGSAKTSSKKTADEGMRLTAAEKKLLEAYRKADKDTKDTALKLLKGEAGIGDVLGTVLAGKKTDSKKDDANPLLSLLGGKAEGSGKKDEANPLASLLGGKTDGNLLSALLGGKTGGLTRMAEEDGTGDAPEEGGILKLIPDEGKE